MKRCRQETKTWLWLELRTEGVTGVSFVSKAVIWMLGPLTEIKARHKGSEDHIL